ncbi:MAG: S8 family serine peptidase [Candidatus Promineifilaceae bacterium]
MKVTRWMPIVGFIFLLVMILGGRGPINRAEAGDMNRLRDLRKVIVPSDAQPPDGAVLWQDYGSFALYGLTDEAFDQLPVQQRQLVQATEALDTILFDGYAFNPTTDELALPTALRVDDPQGKGLHIIQFVGPIKDEWLTAVSQTGTIPISYISHNAYLVWTDAPGRQQLQSLTSNATFLQYSQPYHPFFKLSAALRGQTLTPADPNQLVTVTVQLYQHDAVAESEAVIRHLSQQQLTPWYALLKFQNSTVTVRQGDLLQIAQLPDVVAIGEAIEIELLDEVQGQILAGNVDGSQTGPSGPGYLAWLNSYGFSNNPADYPIIDITDGGVGNGTLNSGDPTLHQLGNVANPSRLAYIENCTSAATGGDVGGHGHINASIAAGYDQRGGFPFEDGDGYQYGLGVNPYGRLASTRMFITGGDLSNCFNDFGYLVWQSYQNGARISSNSWGCSAEADSCLSTYTATTQLYDAATRDADSALPGNQELIFIFGAGNNSSAASINTPANGKNVITVGASENDRPSDIDGCGYSVTAANNLMDMATFSSRGPAPGGRIKPEIVAPGTHVAGTTAVNFDGTGVCGGPGNHGLFGSGLNPYYPAGQTFFSWSSGTSHATPAISGVASLYYYWLENEYALAQPSPAMIKAYLMAHTRYLTGLSANDTLPSNAQGYGMPDMSVAFDETARRLVDQSVLFDGSGETWTLNTAVADPTKPVRIVLAYTDQPGLIGTSPQVNDLNLQVSHNSNSYRGNRFSGQWSTTGGPFDAANNYESIFLPPGTTGNLTVTVTAFNIAGDGVPNHGDGTDQDFAFVCYNCAESSDFALQAAPADVAACTTNSAVFTVQLEAFGGFNQSVNLSVSGQPAGTTAVFSPNTLAPNGSSTLTINNTGAAAPGSYKLTITGSGSVGSRTTTAWLHLGSSGPSAINLLSPANQATEVLPGSPTFTWQAAPAASSYAFQLATDVNFTDVVYQTAVSGSSFTVDGRLSLNTTYYWRVLAANACGQVQSPTRSFSTAGTLPLLLVDDDNSDGFLFGDVRPAFTAALNSLNIPYDVWQVETGSEPTANDLSLYDAVIWFSGDTPAGPSAAGEVALSGFLDGGGCLLISSEGYHKTWGLTSFMGNYLGVTAVTNDVNYNNVTGAGPAFAALGSFALSDNTFWNASAAITPNSTAEVAFTYSGGSAGISKETSLYHSVYLGFGLEDMALNGRTAILESFFNWCNGIVTPPSSVDYLYLPFIVR